MKYKALGGHMESRYHPLGFERKIYQMWLDQGAFYADPASDKPAFSVVLPPPNITGILHVGHALNHSLQDIMVRYKRLLGFETLWLPGIDHASIATEVKVLNKIKKEEGKTKQELTREAFLKKAWAWKETYGQSIVEQMKLLGNSCDWEKQRFTMDQGCNDAVTKVFVDLYNKGMIYKGNRLINWCPDCGTTISDAEVDREPKPAFLWNVRYPFAEGEGWIEISTSRPETMFGDVAIAVHPEDERYQKLIGQYVVVPLVNRHIPIIADEAVEKDFGTGALKITPAHDETDYQVGLRHHLEVIETIAFDATMNEQAGIYCGLDRYETRARVVEELKKQSFLVSEKPYEQPIGRCYRCHTDIEPMISDQWFVKMDALLAPTIEAFEKGKPKFIPANHGKTYKHWLETLRDWNISRQLWWGHRIPAYECQSCGRIVVAEEMPDVCPDCGQTHFKQDEDVLDTWFSSALWPFSTMGWPEETAMLDKFFPTDIVVTGYDIILPWIVRMAFMSIECKGELPFSHVMINGLIREKDGSKMSKSSANGIDPIQVIEKYGADALRFGLVYGNGTGADSRLSEEKIEGARNFANKLWNASRFVILSLDGAPLKQGPLTLADQWILSRLTQVTEECTALMDKYEIMLPASILYDFIWNEYCDWYIELAKQRLYSDDVEEKHQVQWVLVYVLKNILRLMHPYMPFITEEIWHHLGEDGLLVTDHWPTFEQKPEEKAIREMNRIMEAIRGIRNIRAEMNVPNARKATCLFLGSEEDALLKNQSYLVSLAHCSEVKLIRDKTLIPEDAVSLVIDGAELFLPLADLIDYEKEMIRLEKEKTHLEAEVARVKGKLSNPSFVNKAPEALVNAEREKQKEYTEMLDKVLARIKSVQHLM